jgi:hypothetical protein
MYQNLPVLSGILSGLGMPDENFFMTKLEWIKIIWGMGVKAIISI